MTSLKFYKMNTLPTTGEVGGIYFIVGENDSLNKIYLCTDSTHFKLFTPETDISGKLDTSTYNIEAKVIAAHIADLHASVDMQNNINKTIAVALHELKDSGDFKLSWEDE